MKNSNLNVLKFVIFVLNLFIWNPRRFSLNILIFQYRTLITSSLFIKILSFDKRCGNTKCNTKYKSFCYVFRTNLAHISDITLSITFSILYSTFQVINIYSTCFVRQHG